MFDFFLVVLVDFALSLPVPLSVFVCAKTMCVEIVLLNQSCQNSRLEMKNEFQTK